MYDEESVETLFLQEVIHPVCKSFWHSRAEHWHVSLKYVAQRAKLTLDLQGRLWRKETIKADQSRHQSVCRSTKARNVQVIIVERSSAPTQHHLKSSCFQFSKSLLPRKPAMSLNRLEKRTFQVEKECLQATLWPHTCSAISISMIHRQ